MGAGCQQKALSYFLSGQMQARKAVTDIERRPHQAVRAYSSSEEREVLVKASQVRGTAASSCILSAEVIYHDHALTYGIERTPSMEARSTQSGSRDHPDTN